MLYIGSKGKMLQDTYGMNPRLLPKSLHDSTPQPATKLPRIAHQEHEMNWVEAIKGKAEISAPFDYATRLTEVMLLGIVSLRAGAKIHYDAANMKVTTPASANAFLEPRVPAGLVADDVTRASGFGLWAWTTAGLTGLREGRVPTFSARSRPKSGSRPKPKAQSQLEAPKPKAVTIRTPGMAAMLTALALVPGAARQQASPTGAAPADQPQLPTFRTGANLVRVDVTVLDHRGNPVPSLAPEDFLIEEDGIPQKVTSMKFVEATGQPTDDVSLPIRSREHAALEAARDDVRVFLIFWDEVQHRPVRKRAPRA